MIRKAAYFYLGACSVAAIWVMIEWWKNPMGHRGGKWTMDSDMKRVTIHGARYQDGEWEMTSRPGFLP